jgi:hypothetical protein
MLLEEHPWESALTTLEPASAALIVNPIIRLKIATNSLLWWTGRRNEIWVDLSSQIILGFDRTRVNIDA